MQSEELKPCPFCGGNNLRFRLSDIEGWIAHVECTDCDDMLGPMSEWKHDNKEDAEKDAAVVWNKRPALEAALSAAEPQPAPSVAVKALDAVAADLLLYNLITEAVNEGVAKATDPDWTSKDFINSPSYQAIRSALSAQVQDVAGWPGEYYSDDPAKLKQLLAQRDTWLVDNDHWFDFTRSLAAAPAKQEG